MNDVVGYFGRDNQGFFMGVVHPVCVYLGEDNVSWLLRFTLSGVYICGAHYNLGWTPRFLSISITRVVATPSIMGPPLNMVNTLPLVGRFLACSLDLARLRL